MTSVILKTVAHDGKEIKAEFAPKLGMNLLSYQKEGCEVIDQNTKTLFAERFAGLGALIGPHFHHRPDSDIPDLPFYDLFPHIKKLRAKGTKEPFSHGIARYAPWRYSVSGASLSARISGKDTWKGVLLSTLEGFDFEMGLDVQLKPSGLFLELFVDSEKPSVIGSHYYYKIPSKGCTVKSCIEPQMRTAEGWKDVPSQWLDERGHLAFPLVDEADFGFCSSLRDDRGIMELITSEYMLKVEYQANNKENSCQLYHPKEASYVCIEPLSAKNPRNPVLKQSSLSISIEIV